MTTVKKSFLPEKNHEYFPIYIPLLLMNWMEIKRLVYHISGCLSKPKMFKVYLYQFLESLILSVGKSPV